MGDLLVPYSLSDVLCKDRKTLRISQRGGMNIKSNLFANNMSKKNHYKYSRYEWKNKAPARDVEQGVHIIWAVVEEILQFHIEICPTKAKTML